MRLWCSQNWRFVSQNLDYGWLLPAMARLPLRWAYCLAQWRGRLNALWARDWVELSLGNSYIGKMCTSAFREMFPSATEYQIATWVRERYQAVSAEELGAWLAIRGRLGEVPMMLEPIQHAMARRAPGRGLVVVMGHFDNLYFGLAGIARCGYPAYMLTTTVMHDERVHARVQQFFRDKYAAYARISAGAALLPNSSEAKKTFYEVLHQGGVVMVVSDTPSSVGSDKGTWVQWMGRQRKMADGALRMAIDTDSELIAMQNWRNSKGEVEFACSSLVDYRSFCGLGEAQTREAVYAPLFAFLEAGIRAHPGRWWAAHLLGDFQTEPLGADTAVQSARSTS